MICKDKDYTSLLYYSQPRPTDIYFNKMLDVSEKALMEGKEILLLIDLYYDYKIDESLSDNPLHYIRAFQDTHCYLT